MLNHQKDERCTLLKPRLCRYQSLIELSVLFRVRSNMNRMATASLETSGSIETNSRWPPRSQIYEGSRVCVGAGTKERIQGRTKGETRVPSCSARQFKAIQEGQRTEKVISVFRIEMVFSIKLTPSV